jgi:hypothetical protein
MATLEKPALRFDPADERLSVEEATLWLVEHCHISKHEAKRQVLSARKLTQPEETNVVQGKRVTRIS